MKLAEKIPYMRKKAKIEIENGVFWACCPVCGKKALVLHPNTLCLKLPWKCKNTKCPEKDNEFEINYRGNKCLI